MFGFLTSPAKEETDPLQTPRAVSAWLRHLPTLDVMARQHRVMGIFDEMRQSRRPIDFNRVAAIEFLDTALAADRRQLIKQYVENVDRAARVADRAWQAVQELSQGFVYAYQASLETWNRIPNPSRISSSLFLSNGPPRQLPGMAPTTH